MLCTYSCRVFQVDRRASSDDQVMEFEQVITSPTPVIKSSGPEMNEPGLADYQRIDQQQMIRF